MTLFSTNTSMAVTVLLLLSVVAPSQALHNTSIASFRYPEPSSAPPSTPPAVESSPRSNVYPQTRIKGSGVESALLGSRHLHKGVSSSSSFSSEPPSVPPAVESRTRVVTDRHRSFHTPPSPSSGVPSHRGVTHAHKSTDNSPSSSQMPPKSPPSPPSAVSRHKRTLYLPLVDNVTYDLAVKTGFAILLLTLVVSAWYLQHYYPHHYYDYYYDHHDHHHDYPSYYERDWMPPDTLPVLRRLLQALRHYRYKYSAASALPH